jgi:hypothetical protein
MTVLKPAAESKFSVCCVWAQPTARATSAKPATRLNPLKICFMGLFWSRFRLALLGIAGDNQTSQGFSALRRVLVLGFQCRDRSIVRNHGSNICVNNLSLEGSVQAREFSVRRESLSIGQSELPKVSKDNIVHIESSVAGRLG